MIGLMFDHVLALFVVGGALAPLALEERVRVDHVDDDRFVAFDAQDASDRLRDVGFGRGHEQRRERLDVEPFGGHCVRR